MLNYAVDPALLQSRVPYGTELDTFAGQTLISLIGFRFLRTKVLGLRIPFHQDFDEVNLRFYVRREVGGSIRRGVVFIREIVPRHAIAQIARLVYNENYIRLPMAHRVEPGGHAEYRWRTGSKWNGILVETRGEAALPQPGSAEQFITEHYWGYAAQRGGGSLEYEVAHQPWRVWSAGKAVFEGDAATIYGADFARVLAQPSGSAFLAEGSPVLVYAGKRVN